MPLTPLNEKGNVILPILMIAAVTAVVGYFSLDVLRFGREKTVSEERRIEAEALANDVLEITKYMILYEPVFYTDAAGPLNHTADRGRNLISLMSMGIGATGGNDSTDLLKACGGFDAKGRQIGTYTLKNIPVFCPSYFRSAMLSTDMLDQMVMQPLAQKGVLSSPKPGQYVLEIVYFDSAKGIDNLSKGSGTFVDFNIGQSLLTASELKIRRIATRVRFLTGEAGFKSKGSERFFEISSEVQLAGSESNVVIGRKQSYITYPSTPRDFALFMIYPAKGDGTNTRSWSEAVRIPASSMIEGRVFFNGDIDKPLADLPTFTELVVLTGDFKPALTKAERAELPKKFLKGVITNFSAPRYMLSGKCSSTDPGVEISNGTNFHCRARNGEATISDYLTGMSSVCVEPPVLLEDAAMTVDCGASDATCPTRCLPQQIVTGPRDLITAKGTYGFIAAPVKALNNSSGVIYGTILGGHVSSAVPLHVISMALLKVGMPGLGSDETLGNYSNLFISARDGISVPLENLPIVYEEGVSK